MKDVFVNIRSSSKFNQLFSKPCANFYRQKGRVVQLRFWSSSTLSFNAERKAL